MFCCLCVSGVPAVVDFAAMRDAMSRLGGDPEKINPICPADLVVDHSVQADLTRRCTHNVVTERAADLLIVVWFV